MQRSRSYLSLLLSGMAIALLSPCLFAGAPAGIAVSNEFVRVRVNPGPQEAGRFAVDTTGGDPSRASDNDKALVYGSSAPWTSYTTVLVDGQATVFGGPSARRAGKGVPVGTVTEAPTAEGEMIVTVGRVGEIEVKQELSFARNPTTRVKDAAKISYLLTNRGAAAHPVGLRIVLDAMLGANDGAPLRAGDRAISTATQLTGDVIPDYWQAFDSLSSPAVISQGALRGPGLTPPDRMMMVDWGTLADHAWDFTFPEGADFTRAGEEEQDTAVALYWDPQPLAPGESRTYATLYGVGGISLSPAQLSLGLTAPAEVDYQYEDMRPFSVVAYLENSGGFEARAVKCTLELPKGLKLAEGETTESLGALKPGETRQVAWRVLPTGEAGGTLKLAAAVASENLEPNRVQREIIVNSPPWIAMSVKTPTMLSVTPDNRYSPNPFAVVVTTLNRGAQAGRNLVVTLTPPEGLRLVEGEPTQVVERFGSGESREFVWKVLATGLPTGDLALAVKATAGGAKPVAAKHVVQVPLLTPELRVYPATQAVPQLTDDEPTLIPVDVIVAPAREFVGVKVSLRYDPAVLEPLFVRRGEAFVEAGRLLAPWSVGRVQDGLVAEVSGTRSDALPLNLPEAQVVQVVFMAKGPGESALTLENTVLWGAGGREMAHRVVAGRITVKAMEEGK